MRSLLLLPLTLLLTTCLDPTVPAFQLEDPFFLVEGRLLAGEGEGEIRIRESAFTEANKQFNEVQGAIVTTLEAGGASVTWTEDPQDPGVYRLPEDADILSGQTWRLNVVLPDGTTIESNPETVPEAVRVNDLNISFEQNSVFDAGINRFIPRFELYLDYEDPAGIDNFYAYEYRYWEEVIICISCERGRYRGGECIEDRSVMPRYDYYCDTDECYRITDGSEVIYGTDEFTNGQNVSGFPIGGIPFMAYGGLLVEGRILSVSRGGYNYGKVIQDLTSGNAGLNATTPAALDGNIRNLDPDGRTVLGFFGAVASASARSFIVRNQETGTPVGLNDRIYPEPNVGTFVPPLAPCEVPGRTSERPEGWGM